jgi:hypothetical protein
VYEVAETEYEVVWLRDLPLSSRYMTAFEALEAVERLHDVSRTTKSLSLPKLPELPPLLAT